MDEETNDFKDTSENKTFLDSKGKISKGNLEDSSKEKLFNNLIDTAEIRLFHVEIILFQFLVLFLNGIHMTTMSALYIPIQNFYSLNDFDMIWISNSGIISVGVGSILSNYSKLVPSRLIGVKVFTFIILVTNIIIGMFSNIYIFIFSRIILCISLGIVMLIMNNILCEMLPIKNRSLFMTIASLGFTSGCMFLNVMSLFITPNLEIENLHILLLVMSIPAFFIWTVFMLRMEDSPRNLILNNKTDEAIRVLEKIIQRRVAESEREILLKEINRSSNNSLERKLSSMFQRKFIVITLLLVIIWTANSYVAYGGYVVLTLVKKEINKNLNPNKLSNNDVIEEVNYNKIIKDTLFVYLISSPGCLLAGFITETKFFGRKITIFIGFLFMGIFCLVGIIFEQNFCLFLGLSTFFMNFTFSGANNYSTEIYPTKIRDKSIGFLYFTYRVGAVLSQSGAMDFYKAHYMLPYYVFVVICIATSIFTLCLPYDTNGKPLDIE